MYLMLGTCPDLAYAVGKLTCYASNLSGDHVNAVTRMVAYVWSNLNFHLKFSQTPRDSSTNPIGYTDSDWAADVNYSCSTAGYVFLLGNTVFSWYSKKQGHVSTSTADTEYTALFCGGEQAFWMRQFYQQVGVPLTNPILLCCDSKSAIAITKGKGTHSKSKAICIEIHAVRDWIHRHEMEIGYVCSKANIADILTKSLPHDLFVSHRDSLGLERSLNPSISSLTQDNNSSDVSYYDDTPVF